jgi:hypothetical protein
MVHAMKSNRSKRYRRRGSTAIEILFVFATLVVAVFMMFKLGEAIIESFFADGNKATSSPLI